MPTTIAFVNGKGGVGKTTCSLLIAAALQEAGVPVSVEDRDPQCSATTGAPLFGLSINRDTPIRVIDTAPNIRAEETVDAIRTADLVVLVTSPSPLDLASTGTTAELIAGERRGPTRVLFNLVQTNNRFFSEMPAISKDLPFPTCEHFFVRRTAYQAAQLQGWKALPSDHRTEIAQVALELASILPREKRGYS